eukprot:TRINITY_DN38453_c0_g1_i1.p1 TRINITY_DN38453_c0_g1~~TRINITY_DN38453_c0_g1_i1.p1  ORF type:complete len:517 (+),score=49.57 TRINITY_DN38453_c0_g1_i1:72-1553(+)
MANHYEILGITTSASAGDLRRAYLKRVLETHPDKGGDQRTFCAVVLAFQELSRLLGTSSAGPSSTPPVTRSRTPPAEQNYLEKATLLLQSMSPMARHSAILTEFSEEERMGMESLLAAARKSKKLFLASDRKLEPTEACSQQCSDCYDDLGSTSSSDEAEICADTKRSRMQTNMLLVGDTSFASDHVGGRTFRGIVRRVFDSKSGCRVVYYNAEVCLNCRNQIYFFMSARKRRELAQCVEDHIALTQALEYVRARRHHKTLEESLSEAIEIVTLEHGLTVGASRRHRGASVHKDTRCLFLRYSIQVGWGYKFNTSFVSPRYVNLRAALQALQRIRLARGIQEVSWKTAFPELEQTLSKVRNEMTKLYLEAVRSNQKAPECNEQGLKVEGDMIHDRESTCNPEADVEQHLLQRGERYLANRDASLLRRLQRTLQQERCKEDARRRRDERLQKRLEAQQKEVQEQRRKELFRWDPHESFGAMQRRAAGLSSTRSV